MKIDFVFADLNLSIIIQKEAPEKCMFHGHCLQKQGALNISMLRLGCCLPPPIKISGNAPGAYRLDVTWFPQTAFPAMLSMTLPPQPPQPAHPTNAECYHCISAAARISKGCGCWRSLTLETMRRQVSEERWCGCLNMSVYLFQWYLVTSISLMYS